MSENEKITGGTTQAVDPAKAGSEMDPAGAPIESALTVDQLRVENERLATLLKARNAEEAARRKKLEALEKAEQERLEASKTELQKAEERATKAETEKKNLEISLLRRDIASKVGLPSAIADRLKGETPEELEADAMKLLEIIPKAENPKNQTKINATNPPGGKTAETLAEKKQRLGLTKGKDIFSAEFNQNRDGGAIFVTNEE